RIQEWSGLPATANILATNSANNTSVNGNSGNITVANCLALSGFALSSSQTYTGAGSTTSLDGTVSPGQCGSGYQIVTTSTTTAGQFTFGASDEWACAIVAYSAASNTSITPTQGAAAFRGSAPTVLNSGIPVPGAGALAFAGAAAVLA